MGTRNRPPHSGHRIFYLLLVQGPVWSAMTKGFGVSFRSRLISHRMQRQSHCTPYHPLSGKLGNFTPEPLMPLNPSLIALIHPTGAEGTGSVLSVPISAISGSVSFESPLPKSKTQIPKTKPHNQKSPKRLRQGPHTAKPKAVHATLRLEDVGAALSAPQEVLRV